MIVQSLPSLAPALRPFVRSFMLMEIQSSERSAYANLTIPASDSTALLLSLSGLGGYCLDAVTKEKVYLPSAYLHGQLSHPNNGGSEFSLAGSGLLALFGVIFTPIGLHAFVQNHVGTMDILRDTFAPAEHFFDNAEFLQEQLQEAYHRELHRSNALHSPQTHGFTPFQKFRPLADHAEHFLCQMLLKREWKRESNERLRGAEQAAYMSRRLAETNGRVRIEHIANELGISERHSLRIMQEQVGVSGKTFGEIQRFMYASRLLCNAVASAPAGMPITSETLHTAIHQAGYYDQSHCIRDFKRFSGSTPLQFLRERHALSEHLISADIEL